MACVMTKENYLLQSRNRLKDPQVGYLLRDVYNLEQILVTSIPQFRKFYRLYKSFDLPDDLTMEEINRLKVELIKEVMTDMVNRMEGGVYHVAEEEKNESNNDNS